MEGNGITVVKVRDLLLVAMPADPDDSTIQELQAKTLAAMEETEAAALILDISAVDTLDSYFGRTVSETAKMIALMGGRTIVVGMRPGVAVTATQLGLVMTSIETALSVEHALDRLGGTPLRGGPR